MGGGAVSKPLDLGAGYVARYYRWAPDRSIEANRVRYEGVPDAERAGIILTCPHGNEGGVPFDGRVPGQRPGWTVESEDPLTLAPSILMHPCGCHGFIRDGKWVGA